MARPVCPVPSSRSTDNKWLTQDANGVWGKTDNEADAKVFTSGDKGVVSLEGLSEGVYTVKETKAPNGYLQATVPTFTVTITDKDADGVLDGHFTATFDETTLFGLVSQDEQTGAAKVTNVKNISQLPLTGAAGVAMFLVLAVALGGVAFVTYSKSRSAARALRA